MNPARQRAAKTVSEFLSAERPPPLQEFQDKRVSSLAGYLRDSVLVEEAFITQRTEKALISHSAHVYYGINVSQLEPIDQVDSLLVGKRISNFLENETNVLIAGKYGIFNSLTNMDMQLRGELLEAEELKKGVLIRGIMKHIKLDGKILFTNDLWKDEYYWYLIGELYSSRERLPSPRVYKDLDKRVSFSSIPGSHLGNISEETFDLLSNEKAVFLYSFAEIAEALYLKEARASIIKIGPRGEEEYDTYIKKSLDTIQLTQAVDIRSTPAKPLYVTPYILRKGQEETRVLFIDSSDAIYKKLQRAYPDPQPLFYANTITPLLRLLAYVAETERAVTGESMSAEAIVGRPITRTALERSEEEQRTIYTQIRNNIDKIAEALERTLIAPLREMIQYGK